jgi:hypothetical protein
MTALSPERLSPHRPVVLTIPTPEYRSQQIPGVPHGKLGDCYVRVVDLPIELEEFMAVNPRVPNRKKDGVLAGPVVKGILTTLTEAPDNMALMNQGIFLLVEDAEFKKAQGGAGGLRITLADKDRHGIVNGGHTYATIRQAIEDADDNETEQLERAWVRVHVLHGIEEDKVGKIAEGLNRSKQVDDPSLDNLDGLFDGIKEVMKGKPGERQIAYHQGDDGDMYISDVLVLLQLFNCERYTDEKHPHSLYRKAGQAALAFKADMKKERDGQPAATQLLVPRVHDILALADKIRLGTPAAAREAGFEFGRMKAKPKGKTAGANKEAKLDLPFIGKKTKYTVPKGWVTPMLAAFRANVDWNLEEGRFEWRMPVDELLDGVLTDLVRVCVSEHRDNKNPPEMVGSRESSYRQCYDRVLLYLARRGKLEKVAA